MMKKILKQMVSILCVLAMIATSLVIAPKMEAEAADAFAGYEEVTLSDFGIKDKTYTGNAWAYISAHALANGNSLNMKKLNFNVIFNTYGAVYFGTTNTSSVSNATGIRLDRSGSTVRIWTLYGNAPAINFSASEIGVTDLGTEKVNIQIAFSVQENGDLKVIASANDCATKSMTVTGFGAVMSNKVVLYAGGSTDTYYLESATTNAFEGYEAITLDDFGVADGKYQYNNWAYSFAKTLKDGSTLAGKKLELNATFYDSSAFIAYGATNANDFNTIRIKPDVAANTITIWSQLVATGEMKFSATDMNITSLAGTNVKIALAIKFIENDNDGNKNDLMMTAAINDGKAKTIILNNYSLGKMIAVDCAGATSKVYLSSFYEKSPATLKKISWADYGITEDKTYTTADVPSNLTAYGLIPHYAKEGVTSLANTSFRGVVAFSRAGEESNYYINYGDSGLNGWGLKITPQKDGTLNLWGGVNANGANAGEVGTNLATISPTKVGKTSFTDGTTFELGIDIWEEVNPLDVRRDLKILIYINGVQYNVDAYIWKNASYYGYLSTNINFRKLAAGDAVKVDLPEATPENLTRIGWENFDILNDTTYNKSNNTIGGVVTTTTHNAGTSLVNTSFRGEVAFKKVNADSGNFMISYGDNGANSYGIRIKPQNDGTLVFQGIDVVSGVHPTIATLNPAKAGLDSFADGTVFELGLDVWESGDDLKINIFINGVQYTFDAYVWQNAAKNKTMSTYNNFWIKNDNDFISVVVPDKEASPENLTYIDWEDFGITSDVAYTPENEDVADGSHFREAAALNTLAGTSFRGIIDLTRSAQPAATDYYYICYGATGSKWSGLRMNLTSEGKLNLVGVGTESTNVSTKNFGSISPVTAGIGSFTGNTFELGIDIWAEGNDIKFNLFFNGKQYNISAYVWENAVTKGYIGNVTNLIVHGASDAMEVKLATAVGSDIVANEAGYLLAGTTMRVDDVMVTNGTTLKDKGDYHVLYIGEDGVVAENVSCYVPGDVYVDDIFNVKDLIAAKKATSGYRLGTGVARWAADTDKSGNVDANDLVLVRELLLTAATAVSTVAAYSLSSDNSVMPIGGFYGPYDSLINDQAYTLIKDSGINFMTFVPYVYGINESTNAQVKETLRFAEKYNLSVFVTDERIRGSQRSLSAKEIADVIRDYSQYKSFVGISIIDEPSAEYYGDVATLTDKELSLFAEASSAINAYSNLSAYTNLFPLSELLHIDKKQGYETLYKNYLKEYCENYNPKYLSYDHYPFEWTTSAVTGFYSEGIDTQKYFKNLAIVRKVAEENHIPFWTYIQSGDYFGYTDKDKNNDNPTEGEFKWQVNVELAFGAKGIQYFPIVQPQGWEATSDGTPDYGKNGLIGANGEPTVWYDYAVDMNTQIKAVDHVLMNSVNEGVMATSYGYAATSMAAAAEYEMPLITNYKNVVTGIDSTGKTYGAIAGCFDYQGKTAVYMVNYDVTSTQTITLDLNGSHTFTTINRYGSHTGSANGELALTIERGEAVLVVFD